VITLRISGQLKGQDYDDVYNAIFNLEVMPSMRALMTAGKALDRDNVAGFNCSYLPIDHPRAFDEMMYILMCGTGVGFSVERQYVSKLPLVSEDFHATETTITVIDSKIGWAKAYRELVSLLYSGQLPSWDVSKVRPAGATLKTFGGRASGSEPLVDLFKFTTEVFKKAAGRKLSSIECHDLCCKIAQIVVVGGVRTKQPSSASATSRTTDSEEQSTDNGGQMNHNAA
jgi:ribonucleoside-triphosphate reductase (thioredoxin)